MFKVHENGDGSTSIFCSKSGKLICKIGKQQKSMGLGCRPVNVIDSSPKNRSCCFNIEKKQSDDIQIIADEQPDILIEECNLPTWDEEPDEDFSADSITSEEFARCLNLVSTEKFKNKPINELKTEFPLRLISRTKSSDVRYPEELPTASSVGQKLLKANEQKNLYCDQTLEMRIKNYENFCRFQINSSYVFNHPNLRCRDKKDYPICTSKNSKFETTHRYTFNRRQRLENLITIKTGLDSKSRKLLLRCNKKLTVSIKRLPDEEIKYWMQKRARLGPIPADLIRGEDSLMGSDSDATVIDQNSAVYVDLCSEESSEASDINDPTYQCKKKTPKVSNFQGVFSSSSSALRNRNGQSPKQLKTYFAKYKNSWVVLNNVLHGLWKCRGEYYVAGTNIKVPFLKDYLDSLDTKTRNSLSFAGTKLIINPRHDHAYHLPFSTTVTDKKRNLLPNSNCLNHKNSKAKVDYKKYLKGNNPAKNKSLKSDTLKSSNSLKPHSVKRSNALQPNINRKIGQVTMIPIVDLTTSPPNSPKKPVGNCSFHCYGCGYNVKNCKELEVRFLASQHLGDFHFVSDPMSFLNINSTSSGIVMEAFPGYKKDSIG